MKRAIKLVSLVAILMMVTGSVYAYDNAYHVKQAPNGKGDLIIFPMYFTAPGGWETKVSVVNTSEVYSVIAKVVFRSHKYSQELLDFLIYLSPTDVWTGTVKNSGTSTVIYSEDDSMLVSSSEFASKANPVNKALFAPQCPDDSAQYGYIEVIETWYGDVSKCYPAPTNAAWKRTTPGVSKYYLKQLYPTDASLKQVPGWDNDGIGGVCNVNSNNIDHTINVLAGYMELQNSAVAGMTTAMRATVFADFDVTSNMNVAEESGLQLFNGQNMLGEVEAAMSKNDIVMPYVNNPASGAFSAHVFNFPTKLSRWTYSSATNTCTYVNGRGPFWTDPIVPPVDAQYICQRYTNPVYDLSENVSITTDIYSGQTITYQMCQEVELLTTVGYSSLFTEGWTSYKFDYSGKTGAATVPTYFNVQRAPVQIDPNRFSFTGIPTLPVVVMFKNGGASLMEGSNSDGETYVRSTTPLTAGSWYPDYQYWNYMPLLGLNNNAAGATYPAASVTYWNVGGFAELIAPTGFMPNMLPKP